ncbi:MAG: hypothetical protein LBI02_11165 [Opitutaceae bacterium]|jgi:hypothetical protein|nr:hypothetical protein [Opitutaceae bacterium]
MSHIKSTPAAARRLASLILSGVALAFASQLAAQTAPAASSYKKGLWLNIWTPRDNKILETDIPDWGAVGSVEITRQPFSPGAVKDDPDYKNYYKQAFFFALEGYLKITKAGKYTLTVDLENAKPKANGVSDRFVVRKYSIYIQGNCLARSDKTTELHPADRETSSMSLSADADLEPGMYQVQIPVDLYPSSAHIDQMKYNYSDLKISFRLKEPGSRRARVLTEDDLFHKE